MLVFTVAITVATVLMIPPTVIARRPLWFGMNVNVPLTSLHLTEWWNFNEDASEDDWIDEEPTWLENLLEISKIVRKKMV